jgi:hypothetical protein
MTPASLFRPGLVPAVFVVLLAAMPLAAHADLVTDAPAGAGDAQSPTPLRYYGSGGGHTQQVYDASYFANFAGPREITAISFRTYPGAAPSAFFSNTVNVSDITIQLSTTAKGGNENDPANLLSTVFADNIGADATTVFSGALTLTTLAPGTFDYTITFATPFLYDPAMGNLLLDAMIPTTATVSGTGFGFLTFDSINDLNDGLYSVVELNNGAATSGVGSTSNAITRFLSDPVAAAVPEPATMSLLGAGLFGMGAMRRKRRAAIA